MEEWRLSLGLQLGLRVRKGLVWTVGNADSMVDYKPPNQAEDDIDKVVNALMPFFGGVMSQMLSPQQKKRGATFSKAFREALESVGERRKEMFELSGLATRPAMQGRGYGSALVRLVTDIADAEGRATWLGSSNVVNTGFYEYLGFRIVESITLGESDPTWNEDPIVVNLMIREPRARVSAGRPHS
ncbi:hypothetical protein BDY19DRAFT_125776 [Irpex rosettiformis]|uniref:Uncharacterized protein n=1 Tax=Irpex rosettiformis TaxID=378272 RepID=A0ACB8U4V3_9APHY|nr:hypothetical protein BDY19DRAFT_125776 [Irpex rosettiformis]